MKKSNEPLDQGNALDLEFPDWSGMEDSGMRVSPETAIALSEEYQERFAEIVSRFRKTSPPPCDVVFAL
jgi:hypothetical protein